MITEVPYAGAEDVDRAVRAAREAFEDGRWSGIAPAERTRAMLAFADAIDANADELAELESLDNGKPVKIARRVDVPLASAHIRYFAGWPTRITGDVLPVAQPNMHCYTRKEPVGVVGQIIPWNFPLLMAAWKWRPRWRPGCTIVLKPAEQTPLTALRLGELALEAGLPRACSMSSPATARPAPRWSTTRTSTRSPSPAPRWWAGRSARRPAGRSSG